MEVEGQQIQLEDGSQIQIQPGQEIQQLQVTCCCFKGEHEYESPCSPRIQNKLAVF